VAVSPSPTTSTPLTMGIISERTSPLGRLTVTRGPYPNIPVHYDPFGPTDLWKEPTRCYAPDLSVTVGPFRGRATEVIDPPTPRRPAVLTVMLEGDPAPPLDQTTAIALVVIGAHDGDRFRATFADGRSDEAIASGGVAPLTYPVALTADNSSVWSEALTV